MEMNLPSVGKQLGEGDKLYSLVSAGTYTVRNLAQTPHSSRVCCQIPDAPFPLTVHYFPNATQQAFQSSGTPRVLNCSARSTLPGVVPGRLPGGLGYGRCSGITDSGLRRLSQQWVAFDTAL